MSEYTKRCPNCYSDECQLLGTLLTGCQMFKCKDCSLTYPYTLARDLRELPPQPAPSMSEQTLDEYNRGVI